MITVYWTVEAPWFIARSPDVPGFAVQSLSRALLKRDAYDVLELCDVPPPWKLRWVRLDDARYLELIDRR